MVTLQQEHAALDAAYPDWRYAPKWRLQVWLANELIAAHAIERNVAAVYNIITNGRYTKPDTDPSHVIEAHDEQCYLIPEPRRR